MKPAIRCTILVTVLGVACSACVGGSDATSTSGAATPVTSTTVSPEPAATTSTVEQTPTSDPVTATTSTPTTTTARGLALDQVVMRARADLARLLDIDDSAIDTIAANLVTWPDGSLGCPQPGKVYTQALVEGASIALATGGQTYEYHAGRDGAPFLCPTIEIPPPIK